MVGEAMPVFEEEERAEIQVFCVHDHACGLFSLWASEEEWFFEKFNYFNIFHVIGEGHDGDVYCALTEFFTYSVAEIFVNFEFEFWKVFLQAWQDFRQEIGGDCRDDSKAQSAAQWGFALLCAGYYAVCRV